MKITLTTLLKDISRFNLRRVIDSPDDLAHFTEDLLLNKLAPENN